jgi:hypothetical protein
MLILKRCIEDLHIKVLIQGQVLLTQTTRHWTPEMLQRSDNIEKCHIFRYGDRNDERSRFLVARFRERVDSDRMIRTNRALPILERALIEALGKLNYEDSRSVEEIILELERETV